MPPLNRKHIDILLALADAPGWVKARTLRAQVGQWRPFFYRRMYRLSCLGLVTHKIEAAHPTHATYLYRLTVDGRRCADQVELNRLALSLID